MSETSAGRVTQSIPQDLIDPNPQSYSQPLMRPIEINSLNRGFVVRVGCQSFAIESKETLIQKLIEYINDPEKTEQKYQEGKLF